MAFNGNFVADMVWFSGQTGANMEDLYAVLGADATTLMQPGMEVDRHAFSTAISLAIQQTDDHYLGLHAGEYMNLSSAGLVLQIMQTSQNLEQALNYACEFANLGCSSMPLSLRKAGDTTFVEISPDPIWVKESPEIVRHTLDGIIAFTLREIQMLTRRNQVPLRVLYAHSPLDLQELQRVWKVPVEVGTPKSAIVLPTEALALPVHSSNAELLQVLTRHAHEKLADLHRKKGFSSIVKRTLLNLCHTEFPDIGQVAANLNMSVRTLQRKLGEDGHQFRAIANEARHDFAKAYLANPTLQIQEIANMLGYAEASAFVRSFKRVVGSSPQKWRAENS